MTNRIEIDIPFNYTPRNYQKPLWQALNSDIKRAIYIWHRRAGKDLIALNFAIKSAILGQVGTYWHVFPTYNQGKKAIWTETDVKGRKYLDYIPPELIKNINSQEMKITFINNSVYQIVGSDDPDALRGAGIKGVIFSEYAEQRPTAWEIIQPMLLATNGWAVFNFTPKGYNHAYQLWEMARNNDKWFTQIITAEETMGQVFTRDQLEEIKNEFIAQGKTLELFNQEYYCSFNSAVDGAYYTKYILDAENEGRISDSLKWEPTIPVDTWWDLGVSDATSIIFTQQIGNEVRIIDYIEENNKGLGEYINLVNQKNYVYRNHYAPHDIAVREFTSGKSRLDTAFDLGIHFDIVPNLKVQDGIDASRALLPKCIFQKTNCKKLINSLTNYKKDFDERLNIFKDKPRHDWASHGADAFRYLAVGIKDNTKKVVQYDYAL